MKNLSVKVMIAVTAVCVILSGSAGLVGGYFGTVMGSGTVGDVLKTGSAGTASKLSSTATNANVFSLGGQGQSIEQVVAAAADSVVEIRTEAALTGGMVGQYVTQGAGSGVIITADGFIATNNHVIDGASKITVATRNGKTYDGKLIGRDSKSDLAVIKVEATDLKPVSLGTSGSLAVGQSAVAIGNPLGQLGGTVTEGIISALDRAIDIDGETMNLLQTSAAINPGNSGGGLFDLSGKLIGIVNAKSSGAGIEGLGFAIPIDTANPVIEELMKKGYVSGRVDAGVELVDINNFASAFYYRVANLGVYVSSVTRSDIALQKGDYILSLDGQRINDSKQFKSLIEKKAVGDTVSLEIYRNGQKQTVSLTLTELKTGK